jgi:hypothetical protein
MLQSSATCKTHVLIYTGSMNEKEYLKTRNMRNVVAIVIVAIALLLIANFVLFRNRSPRTQTRSVSQNNLSVAEQTQAVITRFEMQQDATATQSFVPLSGTSYKNGEESVQVYTFPTQAQAEETKVAIGTNGYAIGTAIYDWVQPPHFYQKNNVLILYFGQNPDVIAAFTEVFGAPFVDAQETFSE